jgi:hypothetical protein
MKKQEQKITRNFTVISNDVVKSLYAHPEAMVLYMYLATNSETFLAKKSKAYMMKDTELSDRGWRKASKKLTEMGLLEIKRVSDGKAIGSSYVFNNVPNKEIEITSIPKQPKQSSFTAEEWKTIHTKKDEKKEEIKTNYILAPLGGGIDDDLELPF